MRGGEECDGGDREDVEPGEDGNRKGSFGLRVGIRTQSMIVRRLEHGGICNDGGTCSSSESLAGESRSNDVRGGEECDGGDREDVEPGEDGSRKSSFGLRVGIRTQSMIVRRLEHGGICNDDGTCSSSESFVGEPPELNGRNGGEEGGGGVQFGD